MTVCISLTRDTDLLCRQAALDRCKLNDQRRGSIPDKKIHSAAGSFDIEYTSIRAEVAVAIFFRGTATALKNPTSINLPDVICLSGEEMEVKYTKYPHGRLLYRLDRLNKLQNTPPKWLVSATGVQGDNSICVRHMVSPETFLRRYREWDSGWAIGAAMTEGDLDQWGWRL